jgi:hypothetical protein
MLAPNNAWLGDWHLNSSLDSIEGFGDFNFDGKEDILIRSPWGIGILSYNGSTLNTLMTAANGTRLGSWKLNTKNDRIAAIGRFNGPAAQILIVNKSGLAILGRKSGSPFQLTALASYSNGWMQHDRISARDADCEHHHQAAR